VRATTGLSGVVGDGAWGQISRGTWETRQGGPREQTNARRECITLGRPRPGVGPAHSSVEAVTTVERRGRDANTLSQRVGIPLGRESPYGTQP
jgi:hypothetical protein